MTADNGAAVHKRYRRLKDEFYGRPTYGTRVMRPKEGVGYEARTPAVDWQEKVKQYHTGRGWYKVPGEDKALRKDDAIKALQNAE